MLEAKAIPLNDILADDTFNCREHIDAFSVAELAKDIEQSGLIQPVTVIHNPEKNPPYKLIAGFRRYKAHQTLARETIDAVVKYGIDEADARVINLKENLNRKQLNIYEEAKSLIPLITLGFSEEKVGKELGKSRGWVQERALLLKLPNDVIDSFKNKEISSTHIRELYTLYNGGHNEALYDRVRMYKDRKSLGTRGQKYKIRPSKKLNAKKQRGRAETEGMLLYLMELMPLGGFWGSALAWSCGNLDDKEFRKEIQIECQRVGRTYRDPE